MSEASISPTPPSQAPVASLDPATLAAIQNATSSLLAPVLTGDVPLKKRCRSDSDAKENSDPSAAQDYKELGRKLSRQIDPFTSIDTIVNFGIVFETRDEDEDDAANDEDADTQAKIQEEHFLRSWKLICKTIPHFQENMLKLAGSRGLRRSICKKIDEGAKAARTDDRAGLKKEIVEYLLVDPAKDTLQPPIPKKGGKQSRGLYHPVTATFLCPLKYDATTETFNAIRAGQKPLTSMSLPRFLYPFDRQYDANDIDSGVLEGHLLIRAAKHILMGPTTALDEPGTHRGKQGNAALAGITTMTPQILAYVAVQARFALTSASQWSPIDGKFNYEDFYWRIVSLLDNDKACKRVIGLFNYHVFGHRNGVAELGQDGFEEEEEDDFAIAKRQQAKRARSDD